VTVCTWNRECLFGNIVDGELHLNKNGEVVRNEWLRTESVRQNVEIDSFIIMPNHLHGIIVVNDPVGATRWVAQEKQISPEKNGTQEEPNQHTRAIHRIAPTVLKSGTVGAIVGQFKSIATKQINQLRNMPSTPVWQRNYYEHIIRNEHALNNIRKYIQANPYMWEYDTENPACISSEIDRVLAKHYGFTDEELDSIINYDIKYRMGRDSEE
jgi:putative transposase